jgi:hypothetical protein
MQKARLSMDQAPLELGDDFIAVDCRTDVRIVVSLPGRFTLASRRDMLGQRREFPCRVVNLTCHAMALATPVTIPETGERVIAHIDYFGKLEGRIVKVFEGGFLVEITMPNSERRKLAGRIEWYEKHKNHDAEDSRGHIRIVPADPYSTLVFADGSTVECIVKDLSASGVAVHADTIPDIGTPVAVGKLVGRVVRHFDDGFAVHFVEAQDPQVVET